MVAHAASTRIWPIVESSAAFLSGCPPCGRTRSRLDMEEYSSRYAQRRRTTRSRGGPSQKVIPCGAPARTSRSIWTEPALSCRNRLSVRHLASDRVPSDFRRPTRSASDQRHVVALSYTLSRDTTAIFMAILFCPNRVPSDFRRPTRSASDQRHVVALSYT